MQVPDGLLTDYFEAAVSRTPDKVAVVDRFGRHTYGDLADGVRCLAVGLQGMGIGRGDHVLVQLPNWYQYFLFHLALTYLGAVIVPISPIYRRREVGYAARLTEAKALVVPAEFRDFDYVMLARELMEDIPSLRHVIVLGDDVPSGMTGFGDLMAHSEGSRSDLAGFEADRPAPDDINLILFTSGTTGDPKGVMHRSDNVLKQAASLTEWYGLTADDVIQMPLPVTHSAGLFHGVWLALYLGARVILQDVWDPDEAIRSGSAEASTYWFFLTVTDLIYHPALEKHGRLPAARDILSILSPKVLAEAYRLLPHSCVSSVYAGTEFGFVASNRADDPLEKRLSTDGRALPGVELKVVDKQGMEVAPGQEGEVLCRGLNCAGYYKRPDLDELTFTGDGFLRTGDVGRIDVDGFITLTGRIKDIVRRGGENVAPAEIEEIVREHQKVANVAVVGYPDSRLGERVCACIIPASAELMSLQEMQDMMQEAGLAKQKWPERIEFFETFPLTSSGKVQKFLLREEVEKRVAGGSTL